MRKYLSTVFCLVAICSHAQKEYIDSLQRAIGASKPDSHRLVSLLLIAHAHVYSHPDSCYYYANEGLKLSRVIKDKSKETSSLSLMGVSYAFIGNFPPALNISLEALRMAESIRNSSDIYSAITSVGAVYYFQKDYEKALAYFVQSLKIAENLHDEDLIANSSGNIGGCYLNLKMLDSSLYFINLAYKKYKDRIDEGGMANELNSLGEIYEKLNKSPQALMYYRLAIPFQMKLSDMADFCETTLGMAGIYKKQDKKDSAYLYAYLSMNAAISGNFNLEQMQAGNLIASLYESENRTDSAFKYLKLTMKLKDTLFNQEKSKSIQNMTYQENIRQLEIADEKRAAEENRVRNLQLLAIGVFIPIFFFGVLLLSRTKVRPRVVEFLGILSLLLFFEFITDLIYPYVSRLTNENPIWEMLFLVTLAALLEPLNFKLEHWVKARLVHKHVPVPVPVMVGSISNAAEPEEDF